MDKQKAKKFVNSGTHEKLEGLLYELDNISSRKDITKTKEKLRDFMGKLFSYSDVFELHDDHILELAETVAGLYPERDDLGSYVYHILGYIDKQIARQEALCKKYQQKLNHKQLEKEKDPDGYLDLKYRSWTYTEGYFRQRIHMYHMLHAALTDLKIYADKGVICREGAKKKTGKKA